MTDIGQLLKRVANMANIVDYNLETVDRWAIGTNIGLLLTIIREK